MRSMRMSLQAARIGASTPSFERHLVQAASRPIVFGAHYSVYVRAVRLALEEKGVPTNSSRSIFCARRTATRERHPFGKIPALEHAGFRLYEAGAITRYVDEAFPGPG